MKSMTEEWSVSFNIWKSWFVQQYICENINKSQAKQTSTFWKENLKKVISSLNKIYI